MVLSVGSVLHYSELYPAEETIQVVLTYRECSKFISYWTNYYIIILNNIMCAYITIQIKCDQLKEITLI